MLEVSKYLVTNITNQKCNHEEIMSRLHYGNSCRHSVQNILSRISVK
jgi:hypothetical protein